MKLVPANLLNEIKAGVTTLATCVEIRRVDGTTYRMTNHDQALTVDGNVYDNKIPFNLAAVSSGSNFASDNTELTLFLDGTTFKAADFNGGVFASAGVTVMLVNFQDTSDGKVILREGWFGPIDTNTYGIAKITIYGMLKVLDIEIGRVYQPSCDADLGDKRCKIAIKQNQTYNALEKYQAGNWVYHFDPAEANVLTVVNPGFETSAPVDENTAIPGWTRSPDNDIVVVDGTGFDYTVLPGPFEGSYLLHGGLTTAGRATERFVYQEIDLVAAGINAADIDLGKISVAYFANIIQTNYLLDPIRIRLEVLNASHTVIDYLDDGYNVLDTFDAWRERSLVGPLIEGARYVRLYIYFLWKDGVVFNAAADNVRAYWWDHTTGSPYSDVIHKVARIVDYNASHQRNAENGSFEADTIANSNTTAIPGWTRGSSADWWQVVLNAYMGISPPDGIRALIGGDDSSGTQKTYELSQLKDLVTDFSLNSTNIDLGMFVAKLRFSAVFYDTVSSGRVEVDVLAADGTTVLLSFVPLTYAPEAAPITRNFDVNFVLPVLSRKIRIKLFARSGVGVSAANVGFDNIRWYFIEADLPRKDDPILSNGEDVTFETTAGSYTIDGALIWKAHTAHIGYDAVSAVTDRKTFNGTAIAGGASAYVTAVIRWISGDNAGQRNLVRLWDSPTKEIKLYFPTTAPIQVGDRFLYTRPCHKRFLEDCSITFDNVLNFRGFPHLPGKLT